MERHSFLHTHTQVIENWQLPNEKDLSGTDMKTTLHTGSAVVQMWHPNGCVYLLPYLEKACLRLQWRISRGDQPRLTESKFQQQAFLELKSRRRITGKSMSIGVMHYELRGMPRIAGSLQKLEKRHGNLPILWLWIWASREYIYIFVLSHLVCGHLLWQLCKLILIVAKVDKILKKSSLILHFGESQWKYLLGKGKWSGKSLLNILVSIKSEMLHS